MKDFFIKHDKLFGLVFITILYFLIVCPILCSHCSAQNVELVNSTANTVTVKRYYSTVETYKKVDETTPNNTAVINRNTGNFGILFKGGYNFRSYVDFGGSLFYNFGGKANGKFGISLGFDYGANQWWRRCNSFQQKYWHGRAGIIIIKYIGLGGIYGQKYEDGVTYNDGGAYATIYMPLCKYFGFNADVKYTAKTFFTVSGGIIITIPTKL